MTRFALEVSSAAGRPPFGGVGGTIRGLVGALLADDPETEYALCTRFSRWRKGDLFRPAARNAHIRLIADPWNALLLRGAQLFHAMGVYVPSTPAIPKLVTIHDLNAVRNADWVSEHWRERRGGKIADAVARADHVVTYSEFTAGEVCEEYGLARERVHPVHLGVDCARFHPSPPEAVAKLRERHGDYVIAIGLLTPRKNFPALVAAVGALPELGLVLVGRGTDGEREVEEALDRHGVRGRTTRLSGIPEEELVALIGAARACAVPSLYEGFGLTVLEAMACGTPVVCSNAASLPEAAGDAALLVDARSPEALAGALRRVCSDAGLAAELSARGLARARAMSWTASARSLRAVYRGVAGA
ncbi:MAG TPA: glycosyltransferase family 1 protein [Myxococcota bacterium]|nr:glycosyltransferase family 1 protein [Myxococcota bacterium]